jgi:hypothetical protein
MYFGTSSELTTKTMLTQSYFFDGLVRNDVVKQAKSIIREEQYTPWKILCLKDKYGGKNRYYLYT